METKRISEEDEAMAMWAGNEFTASEVIMLLPDTIKNQYHDFCSSRHLQKNEESATAFLDWYMDEQSDRMPVEDELYESVDSPRPGQAMNTYMEWSSNLMKLSNLSSDEAVEVTLWRYKNPGSSDKGKCGTDTGIAPDKVDEWWNTVDWIDCVVGGHFHPVPLNTQTIKDFLLVKATECMDNCHKL